MGPPSSASVSNREHAPPGIAISGVWEILAPSKATRLGRLIDSFDLLINPSVDGTLTDNRLTGFVDRFMGLSVAEVVRKERVIDVRPLVSELELLDQKSSEMFARVAGWDAGPTLMRARVAVSNDGSAKPIEVAQAIGVGGTVLRRPDLARLGFAGKAALYNPSERLGPLAAARETAPDLEGRA